MKQVSDDDIVKVLSKLAEKEVSDDELAPYDSVSEILDDDDLAEAEKKRMKLKADRRSNIPKR